MNPSRSRGQTRPASLSDVRAYLSKAEGFLQAAADSLGHGNRVAVAGNAVHAGIAAADVISAARSGAVWKGEHTQAAGHLERAGGAGGGRAAVHFRRLLPLENRAECDPAPVTPAEAREAHRAAQRIVAIAELVVASVAPPAGE
ncbi:MAG TPA: hypothetical protein VKV36_03380 [Acidimicrobiales bacterium]|nr:hypothetical protein [Acidimicrobiales bacterium]